MEFIMTEVTKLNTRLAEMKARINVFPGTNPNATPEEVAKEINKALDRIEAGDFEEVK
jgi:hypothetical protein